MGVVISPIICGS